MNADLARLEDNLRRQLDGHARLLACVERSRDAVRSADLDRIAAACEQENAVVQELAELEKARLEIVGRLTQLLEPDAAEPVTLARIAEAADGKAGGRLAALAAQLRTAVQEVRSASAVVRAAADALSRHMAGLMQTVQSVLGSAAVYGRQGRLQAGDQKRFCIDVKT